MKTNNKTKNNLIERHWNSIVSLKRKTNPHSKSWICSQDIFQSIFFRNIVKATIPQEREGENNITGQIALLLSTTHTSNTILAGSW